MMKRLRQAITKLGILALVGASCATRQVKLEEKVNVPTAYQETEEGNYRIVFQSDRDGNSEIYVMNADGSGQTNLTNNPNEDISPTPSPDGRKIAYVSHPWQKHDEMEIWVMDANGENKKQLTDNNFIDRNPVWAPDSKSLIFLRETELPKRTVYGYDKDNQFHALAQSGAYIDIHSVDLDGNEKNLTRSISHNMSPSFSSDGKKITFTSDKDGNYEIYVMNRDGNNQVRLTKSAGRDYQPTWSPDGKKILFFSDRTGVREIYITNPDRSELDRLTSDGNNDNPSWSPDGKMIAYRQITKDYGNICIMDANGSNKRNITLGLANESNQEWSPDGKALLFSSSTQAKSTSIYTFSIQTNKTRKLTSPSASNYNQKCIRN